MQGSDLDLILKFPEEKLNYRYKNLTHNPEKLKSFLQNTEGTPEFSFAINSVMFVINTSAFIIILLNYSTFD